MLLFSRKEDVEIYKNKMYLYNNFIGRNECIIYPEIPTLA